MDPRAQLPQYYRARGLFPFGTALLLTAAGLLAMILYLLIRS